MTFSAYQARMNRHERGCIPFRGGEGGIASRLAVGRAELELDHPHLFPKA
jgi:hypothetical protein